MQASASHILVKTEAEAQNLKTQIDGGADFTELAAQNSQCPSKERGGALGTFGQGAMVKEFETVVFGELPVGQCSEPVQTQFGWHLIVVTERPAMVASARHILAKSQEDVAMYKATIEGGTDFAEMAEQHSQCPSGQNGGELGTFGRGQMVKEFEDVIFGDLEVGKISEPFQTQFGWHIVEVTERKPGE